MGVLRARLADPASLLLLFATVSISASGLEIATESSHAVQAHAYLYASIFARYEFTPPEAPVDQDVPFVCFELKLDTLIGALSLLEDGMAKNQHHDAFVELSYDGVGHPLCLSMHDGNRKTRFRLRTLDAEAMESVAFDASQTAVHVIMPSEWMSNAFQDIESTGGEHVRVRIKQGKRKSLVLATLGVHGSAEIELPDSDKLAEKFQCNAPTDNCS
ncbi:hypothetical protein MCUN1_002945 [Malassezia cuniculi]|uniref:Uncharacterized protein n=1 Tax=Malassezia cuniculi TaxID=948313 RepID=A0AAF0J7U2_9BASI|nr:hypothetical protein MCUN1_002945 [Malassezia cuniculi]